MRPALVRGSLPIVEGNTFLTIVLFEGDCAFSLLLHSLVESMRGIKFERVRLGDGKMTERTTALGIRKQEQPANDSNAEQLRPAIADGTLTAAGKLPRVPTAAE
jgi:hypothetical protein